MHGVESNAVPAMVVFLSASVHSAYHFWRCRPSLQFIGLGRPATLLCGRKLEIWMIATWNTIESCGKDYIQKKHN